MSEEQVVGRTGWDALFESRKQIVALIACTVIGVFLIVLTWMGYLPMMEQFVIDFWPVLVSPAIGYLAATETVKKLYLRSGVIVLVVNSHERRLALYVIPEETYKLMNPIGNTVVFSSGSGRLVYLARSIDWNTLTIDYGWIHSVNNADVLVNLDLYNEWMYDLEDTQLEIMRLKHHPHVIGASMARKFVEEILNDLAKVLGLMDSSELKAGLDLDERIAQTFGDVPIVETTVPDAGVTV